MESPRKFNDCYFYYYSTCTKGDNCVFRHEPSALGCETMCAAWQQGKCLDKRCKLRHMELRKNRKQIPCYWETQPGGCRKKHCPFMHKNPEARADVIPPSNPQPMHPMMPPVQPTPVVSALADPIETPLPLPPQAMPMLWQHPHQPRQVVLDSSLLNVLPNSTDMLPRRVMPQHHEQQPPYGPMPVDPLVVNFEEESDNEYAPPSTPDKNLSPYEDYQNPTTKTQELLLLEKIQAETAALYSYDYLPPPEPKIKQNMSLKYDRLSLDEITGRPKTQPTERRPSIDFKVLSLDEIRARKNNENSVQTPITLNLRKRTLSTQETVETNDGNKIIKVVRSNSIVYKKLDQNTTPPKQTESKTSEVVEIRKRKISEVDIYDFRDDELVDNCYGFKKIKILEQSVSISTKPRFIRNKQLGCETDNEDKDVQDTETSENNANNDESDSEVEVLGVELPDNSTNIDLSDSEVECTIKEPETIELSEDEEIYPVYQDLDLGANVPDKVYDDSDLGSNLPDLDLETNTNVPDIVASCQKSIVEREQEKSSSEKHLEHIDSVLSEDLMRDLDSVLNDDVDGVNAVLEINSDDDL